MSRELYQKKHGLPGLPLTRGADGLDGRSGNNIYFGNIAEFFNSMTMPVDTFIRVAEKRRTGAIGISEGYTGVFEKIKNGDDEEGYYFTYNDNPDVSAYTWTNGYGNTPGRTKIYNQFEQITNVTNYT